MPRSRRQLYALACACLFALTCAAQNSTSSGAAKSQPSSALQEASDSGEVENSVYRNSWFGFTCRIPFGWVDRTDEMRQSSKDPEKATVLVGMFERPPMAAGSTVNSGIMIAAESATTYPGLKGAAQYFGPLTEVTTSQGMTKVNEPYEFPVDGKPIVREDFVKKVAGVAMHQSTLAWLTQGSIVSFTFVGGSDDEVQSLIEGLKIEYSRKPAKDKAKPAKQ